MRRTVFTCDRCREGFTDNTSAVLRVIFTSVPSLREVLRLNSSDADQRREEVDLCSRCAGIFAMFLSGDGVMVYPVKTLEEVRHA